MKWVSAEEEPDIYGPEWDSDAFTEWDSIESKTSADNEEQDDVAEEAESAAEASAAEPALAMEVDSAEIGFGGIDDEDAESASSRSCCVLTFLATLFCLTCSFTWSCRAASSLSK